MSTTYTLFTEVMGTDHWYCINPLIKKIDLTADSSENELMLVPTFETNARHDFEKIYYLMLDDGYRIGREDLSHDLLSEMEHRAAELYNPVLAIDYDRITGYLHMQGKEHCAFALRSDVAAYENGHEDDIYDYVGVDEYRDMDAELKKAYQYYEWNSSHGVFRYYSEIKDCVDKQLADWQYVNKRRSIVRVRLVLFIS